MGKRKKRSTSVAADNVKVQERAEPNARITALTARTFWIVAVLVVLVIAAIYGQAIDAPFIFDDYAAIVTNKSIVELWPLVGDDINPGPLNPLPRLPTSARPVVNLSFALNYSVGQLNPIGYRLVNVALHILSTLMLWAIVLRTLRLPRVDVDERTAIWLASATAILWSVHPLQSETVAYATQRTEGLMAFFYLATLYCSLRYWATTRNKVRLVWLSLAVFACGAGMLSKEVMVSAPLMVLLFERTFVAQSLGKAIRDSWPLYIGLFATWIIPLVFNLSNPHGDVAGLDTEVPLITWWLTQAKVVLIYFTLAAWPWPLQIHYAVPFMSTIAEAWPYLLAIAVVGVATLVLLWRNHPLGYLATWIFVILSPTSLVPITTEVAAERRLYLPLAAMVALVVVGGYMLACSMLHRARRTSDVRATSPFPRVGVALLVLVGMVYIGLSAQRVAAYRNPRELWTDVVRRQPQNHLALQCLAAELVRAGRPQEAADWYKRALQIKPDSAIAHSDLGKVLLKDKQFDEALAEFHEAVRLEPNVAEHHNNVGVAYSEARRFREAMPHFRKAIDVDPRMWLAEDNLGSALAMSGQLPDAVKHYERALQINPRALEVYGHLADAYAHLQQPAQALAAVERALELARSTRRHDVAEKIALQLDAYRAALTNRDDEAVDTGATKTSK